MRATLELNGYAWYSFLLWIGNQVWTGLESCSVFLNWIQRGIQQFFNRTAFVIRYFISKFWKLSKLKLFGTDFILLSFCLRRLLLSSWWALRYHLIIGLALPRSVQKRIRFIGMILFSSFMVWCDWLDGIFSEFSVFRTSSALINTSASWLEIFNFHCLYSKLIFLVKWSLVLVLWCLRQVIIAFVVKVVLAFESLRIIPAEILFLRWG